MTAPWSPEELDLLLSGYLDGELDLAVRMALEVWLQAHPEGRDRLRALKAAVEALGGLGERAEVPPGWTVQVYRIGLPRDLPVTRRMAYLGLGLAMVRPRAFGHRAGTRKGRRCGRTRIGRTGR
jgi:anti-sigma factor RsiW